MEGWAAGLLLVLLGCLASSAGLILMKHSSTAEAQLPRLARPFWWAGFGLLLTNALFIDVAALSLAPLSLVAPFSGVTILFTAWFAASGLLYVRERVTTADFAFTTIALAGVSLASAFGPHGSDAADVHELRANAQRPAFRVFVTVAHGLLALLWAAHQCGPRAVVDTVPFCVLVRL